MKKIKIYTLLTYLLLESISISAQSRWDLFFNGNKDSLIIEATQFIHLPDPACLPILFFNLPESAPFKKYSYRATKSRTPEDYIAGLKTVTKPMIILIVDQGEPFSAKASKDAVLKNSFAKIQMITGTSHNGVREKTFIFIEDWFSKL